MRSKWITHHQNRIMLADCSGFKENIDALEGEVNALVEMLIKEPVSSVLLLLDVSHTTGTMEGFECFKRAGIKTKHVMKRVAAIGVSGKKVALMKAIMNFSGIKINLFDDIDAAKEWLISD